MPQVVLITEWISDLYPGFAFGMEWDCFDGVSIDHHCGSSIPSDQDYAKIVAYGAILSPPGPDSDLNDTHWVLCQDTYCDNDGAVPIQSALFYPIGTVRTRTVGGSCDHDEICNGQKTVQDGTPIF